MAKIDDVRAGILEIEIYTGMLTDGELVELAVTLLDLHGDALPFAGALRERGAQSFGMLFFDTNSPTCPTHGVIWARFGDGLELAPEDSERYLLEDEKFFRLCFRMTATFLKGVRERSPKYAWLAPPRALQ